MSNVEQIVERMLSDTASNRIVLLGVSYSQREEVKRFVDSVRTQGLDARDLQLPWGTDPVGTLSPNTHQVYTQIAVKKSSPAKIYQDLVHNEGRKSFFSLPIPRFIEFREMLASFMDDVQEEFYRRNLENPLICDVPNRGYGMLVCHSIRPCLPQRQVPQYDA